MSDVADIARGLTRAQIETLEDLCRCPGLFVGQYHDVSTLPFDLLDQRFVGLAGMLGLAKAYPTDLAFAVLEELEK